MRERREREREREREKLFKTERGNVDKVCVVCYKVEFYSFHDSYIFLDIMFLSTCIIHVCIAQLLTQTQ